MITLALQIFLLLLSAYLVGCMLGCLLRRSFYNARRVPEAEFQQPAVAVQPAAPPPAVATPESARFERALTGQDVRPSPTVRREPVVEVRPHVSETAAPPSPAPAPVRPAPAEIEIVKAPPPAPPPATPAPAPVAAAPAPAPPPPAASVAPKVPPPAPPPPAPPPPASQGPAAAPHTSSGAAAAASYAAIAAASAAAAGAARATTVAPPPPPPKPVVADAPKPPAPPAPSVPEVKPAVQPVAAPEPVSTAPAAPPRAPVPADDLKRIRAIDRTVEGRLNGAGVRRFSEIAAWNAGDVARMNQTLGFTGARIEQENWIEQAQILARGGETDYSRRQRISTSTTAAGLAVAAASAAASHAAQKSAGPDRFTRIIGIDPETEKALYGMGVTRYAQIAHWTSSDIEKVERALNRPGRVGLDNWVEQARILARYAGETEAPRPVRLADAIRENREPAAKAGDTPVPRADQRSDLVGLRSVRSEALRGEVPAPGERTDDLKRIRGIGVLIEKRLNALGIVSYEQIANWTVADIDRISTSLDFKGRIERENWIEQSRILASGGQTEFSRRVDRGEVDSSKET